MNKKDNKMIHEEQISIERSAVEQYIKKLKQEGSTVKELDRGINIVIDEDQEYSAVLDGHLEVVNKRIGVEVFSTQNQNFDDSVAKKINTDVLKLITLINLGILHEGVIIVPEALIEPFKKSKKLAKLYLISNNIEMYGYKSEGQLRINEIVYHAKLRIRLKIDTFVPGPEQNAHTENVFDFAKNTLGIYLEDENDAN